MSEQFGNMMGQLLDSGSEWEPSTQAPNAPPTIAPRPRNLPALPSGPWIRTGSTTAPTTTGLWAGQPPSTSRDAYRPRSLRGPTVCRTFDSGPRQRWRRECHFPRLGRRPWLKRYRLRPAARRKRCRRWVTSSARCAIPCRNAGIAIAEVHPETLHWKPSLRSRDRAARTPIRAPANGPIPPAWPSPGPNWVVPLSRLERYPSPHRLKLGIEGYESVAGKRDKPPVARSRAAAGCSAFWRAIYSPISR